MTSRTLEFLEDHESFRKNLEQEYRDNWEIIINELGAAKNPIAAALGTGWDEKLKSFQTHLFAEFLVELYFCPDRETYKEIVQIPDTEAQYLFPPQWEVVTEVNEWENENFSDIDRRKTYVEETISDFTENPLGGEKIEDIVHQFEKGFK